MLSDALKRYRALYYETPGDTGSGGGPAADPAPSDPSPATAEPAAAPASPAPTSAPTSPWSESLQKRFEDENQRTAVDAYLREEIQPYITRREQELGGHQQLIDALQDEEQSYATYLGLAEQLYGPEIAQELAQVLARQLEEGGNEARPEGAEADPWANLPPELREIAEERAASTEDAEYEAELATIAQQEPSIAANPTAEALFDKYVAALEGDMEQALALWKSDGMPNYVAAFTPAEAEATEAEPAPPAVLGTSAAPAGTSTPANVQKDYGDDLDAALDDFMHDVRRARETGAAGIS